MKTETPEVPYFELTMALEDLSRAPRFLLPAGHRVEVFSPGDESVWARIERSAGEFSAPEKALARFAAEFGDHREEMTRRCLFLREPGGEAIGTATAWYGDFAGATWGRLHWVAIVPAFQGRGLAKPLVSQAIELMTRWHRRAYLTTQTTSFKAVKVYLDFGFRPTLDRPESPVAWGLMGRLLGHPALEQFL